MLNIYKEKLEGIQKSYDEEGQTMQWQKNDKGINNDLQNTTQKTKD